MKKILAMMLMLCIAVTTMSIDTWAVVEHDEMRAVWIATVSNIDYPNPANKDNPRAQKQEYIDKLDQLQLLGINTVIMQVRPKADAFYDSAINPWSDVLTGTQGKYPGYDPMEFMIEEAHKRGMAFHAWLNPYRVTTSGTDLSKLSQDHPARLHPEWLITYNNALYYNPEVEAVKVHIEDTIEEIVKNYDVDGIHFDDYFYPSNYPLPAGESKDGPVANARRGHVNDMIKRVGQVVDRTSKDVVFGVSPMGIWKNNKVDPTGSATGGGESYYTVCADTRTWIQNEYIDYVIPQIYWETGHRLADYETLVKWWSNEVEGTDVKLYIGQGIYKDVVAQEITEQLRVNQRYEQVEGSVYFSLKDLLNNRKGCADAIQQVYTGTSGKPGKPVSPEKPEKPVAPTLPSTYEKGKVTTNNLNVRTGAGTNYAVVAKAYEDMNVKVFNKLNDWYYVQLPDGTVGYVSSEYVQIEGMPDVSIPRPEGSILLVIDGQVISSPVAPIIYQGTTLVPIRIVSENLGAVVDWNSKSKEIKITKGTDLLKLTVGSTQVSVNGEVEQILAAPQIIQGTTMVPIRFVSENLDALVDWNSQDKIITINSK